MSNNKQNFKDGYQPRKSDRPSESVKGGYQPTKSEGGSPTNPPPKRK
ncbi:hypothetical protein OS318_004185 [Vibrio vulnificus]|nr:hypothetical protein [Vibrio vulnificus]